MSELIALLAPVGGGAGLQAPAAGKAASGQQGPPVDAAAFQQAFRQAVGERTKSSSTDTAPGGAAGEAALDDAAAELLAQGGQATRPAATTTITPAELAPAPPQGTQTSLEGVPQGTTEATARTPVNGGTPAAAEASAPADGDVGTAGTARPVANPEASAGHEPVDSHAVGAAGAGDVPEPGGIAESAAAAARAMHRPAVARAVHGAAAAVSTAAPTSRSFDTLDPEFRARLERVIGRAERELGFEVRVLETYRDPARQQALFEQGRTTAGPVVTWTRNSLHSEGRATDLQLVGAAANPAAYVRLGQIAAQEGLRTLGPSDPGHVELPRTGALDSVPAKGGSQLTGAASDAADANERIMAFASAAGRSVPRAQDVASYVREVARAALSGSAATSPAAQQPARAPLTAAAIQQSAVPEPASPSTVTVPAAAAPTHGRTQRAAGRDAAASAEPVGGQAAPAPIPMPSLPADQANAATSGMTSSANAPEAATPMPSTSLDSRIERAVALQETLAARPVHSVLLRLDEAASPLAQIRVGIRGSEVMAALDVSDPRLAGMLRAELPELQRALEKQGLDLGRADALRVLGGAAVEGNSVPRAAESFARGGSDTPYRQPNGGGQRDPSGGGHPQQRSRDQQRGQKEQP